MRKTRFSEEQIINILKGVEAGQRVADACGNWRPSARATATSGSGCCCDGEGWEVNHKRVYRLYVEEGLKLRKRWRRSRAQVERIPLAAPAQADERYSMDFMRETLADGRAFRTLNIVDDYTRACLAIEVDTSSPGARVVRVLERLAAAGRRPLHLVVDNGPEFSSKALDQWAARNREQAI
jgi:transposase InsO family protein